MGLLISPDDRPQFDNLIERRFAGWNLRILRDGWIGLVWLWPRDS